jgi:hypothetical protein
MLAAANASASTTCPWLIQGSAAKVLNEDVSVTVTITNQTQTNRKLISFH